VHDTIRPAMAINKEIELRFVVGYSPSEFRDTLHLLANGKVDAGSSPAPSGSTGSRAPSTRCAILTTTPSSSSTRAAASSCRP